VVDGKLQAMLRIEWEQPLPPVTAFASSVFVAD